MLTHNPLRILQKRWKFLFVVGIIVSVLSGAVTFLFPFEYRSDAQILIISQSRYGVDPYTAVKSAERIGENLSQVVGTSDFYRKTKTTYPDLFDWSTFDRLDERKKRKAWSKQVNASVVFGTGILSINTFHKDRVQAGRLASAVIHTLEKQAVEYVGGDVVLKVVNEPVTTRFPARPNILLNLVLGFLIGVLVAGFVVVRK